MLSGGQHGFRGGRYFVCEGLKVQGSVNMPQLLLFQHTLVHLEAFIHREVVMMREYEACLKVASGSNLVSRNSLLKCGCFIELLNEMISSPYLYSESNATRN